MTVQAWVVMTVSEKNSVIALSDPDSGVGILPMEIVNALANNLGYGTLVGSYVAPARILNDIEYAAYVVVMGALPIHVMDSDTLFVPPPVEEW